MPDDSIKANITYSNPNTPEELKREIRAIRESFIASCQKQYFAFVAATTGLAIFHKELDNSFKDATIRGIDTSQGEAALLSVFGTKIAKMDAQQARKSSEPGGTFEDSHAKAFIVLVYSLWEDNFRVQIANKLPINEKENDRVKSNLMGDIRYIRHHIVHPSAKIGNLKVLPEKSWKRTVQYGITEPAIGVLMEQINAIEIKICNIPECKCSQNGGSRCLGMLTARD